MIGGRPVASAIIRCSLVASHGRGVTNEIDSIPPGASSSYARRMLSTV